MLSDRELAEFKRGPLQMIALYLLGERDMYGYQMVQEVKRKSEGKFVITVGALYIVLYRLIERGYISSTEETGVKKPRVFYHLEPSGRELLEDLMNAYYSVQEGVAGVLDQDVEWRDRNG